MEGEDVWGGVPPAGEKDPGDRRIFIIGVISVMLVEWVLWATYRYLSFPVIGSANSRLGFLFHIIAAPLIGLTPIIVYFKFIRKEKGLPWRFTKKNLFSSVLVGASAAAVLMLLYQLANWLVMVASGYGIPSGTVLYSLWRSSVTGGDLDWFILMTFTYFFIVGPVEELQYRSFVQDQLGRVMKPSYGLLIASAMFALSHLPIYFIVYRLDFVQASLTLCWTFTMGFVLGVFYLQSRNIIGPIIMHGLWDWILSVWMLDIGVKDSYFSSGYLMDILWLSAIIPMALLTMMMISLFFYGLWKDGRPRGSLGGSSIPLFEEIVERAGTRLGGLRSTLRLKKGDEWKGSVKRSLISVVGVCAIVMICTLPGATVPEIVVSGGDGGGDGIVVTEPVIMSFDEGLYVSEGAAGEVELSMNSTWTVLSVKVTVFWIDEDPSGVRYTNAPDTFSAEMVLGGEGAVADGPSESGSLSLVWANETGKRMDGISQVSVTCEEAGDQSPIVDVIGLRRIADDGNDITVSVQIEYFEP